MDISLINASLELNSIAFSKPSTYSTVIVMTFKLLDSLIIFVLLLGLTTWAYAQFTDEEKEEMLRAHNNIRGKVDPVATNMEEMVTKNSDSRVVFNTLLLY